MRIALFAFIVSMAGCPASTPVKNPEPDPTVTDDNDTLMSLMMGLPREDLEQRVPEARATADGLRWAGRFSGRPAEIVLEVDDGLSGIRVHFNGTFDSMDACGETWAVMRKELDAYMGDESTADNLAAYWSGDDRSYELACNPVADGPKAALSFFIDPVSPE